MDKDTADAYRQEMYNRLMHEPTTKLRAHVRWCLHNQYPMRMDHDKLDNCLDVLSDILAQRGMCHKVLEWNTKGAK